MIVTFAIVLKMGLLIFHWQERHFNLLTNVRLLIENSVLDRLIISSNDDFGGCGEVLF